ncbi:uncharacterized protein O3C94_019981 [Discoglossus pictus]
MFLEGQARLVSADCYPPSSSSESSSSEEKFQSILTSNRGGLRQSPGRFPSQWDPHGRSNHKENPWWEEETGISPGWE